MRTGTRVAIMSSNRPEFAIALFAVLKLGCALVTLSPAWKQSEVAFALDLTDPTHVIHDDAARELLAPHFDATHLVDLDDPGFLADVVDHAGERLGLDVDWANTDAVLVFSSGTTGLPKAVRHTHRSLGAGVVHWRSALGLTANDSFQITTPPSHVLGLLNLVTAAAAGAAVRLHPRFDVDAMLGYVERDRTTLEMAVAPIALAMAQNPDLERYDLSSLRYIVWGATPITESVARRGDRAHRCALDARLRGERGSRDQPEPGASAGVVAARQRGHRRQRRDGPRRAISTPVGSCRAGRRASSR